MIMKKQSLQDEIERVVSTHENVIIEIHRTEPNTFCDGGLVHVVPSWITQTITITSRFYYMPKEDAATS